MIGRAIGKMEVWVGFGQLQKIVCQQYINFEEAMSIRDFEILSKLGEGAYSTVYKVVRHADNKTYALKRVKMMSLSPKQKQNALNEIRILASVDHPNVISYKEAFIDEPTKSLCIVMEFANNGDLAYRITEKQKKGETFEEAEIWQIFIQVVKGLNELHNLNIFHRDIKSANVFLHQNGDSIEAKLGDMNVSKISEKGMCLTQTGTPYYASPQVWKDKPYDSKSDIWSLGCVLYEMITLKPPFRSEDMQGLYKKVTRGIYPRIPSQYSQDLSSMIRCLLQVNPEMRPSCDKILRMPVIFKKERSHSVTEKAQKPELLRTIKPGETFCDITEQLPRPNYVSQPKKKQKGMKSLIQTMDDRTGMQEVDSLPFLEKQKKIRATQNSDRVMLKEKQSINMLNRDRKKSEMGIDRGNRLGIESGINRSSTNNAPDIKELKLPKVQNRYNKAKERLYKQKSLRSHKIYQ